MPARGVRVVNAAVAVPLSAVAVAPCPLVVDWAIAAFGVSAGDGEESAVPTGITLATGRVGLGCARVTAPTVAETRACTVASTFTGAAAEPPQAATRLAAERSEANRQRANVCSWRIRLERHPGRPGAFLALRKVSQSTYPSIRDNPRRHALASGHTTRQPLLEDLWKGLAAEDRTRHAGASMVSRPRFPSRHN